MSHVVLSIPIDILVLISLAFTFIGYCIGSWWTEINVNEPMRKFLDTYKDSINELKQDIDSADWWKRDT